MLSVLMLAACGNDDGSNPKQHAGECVVLLHGSARSSLAMERMKWFLEENG
jgi:hypothetical protein